MQQIGHSGGMYLLKRSSSSIFPLLMILVGVLFILGAGIWLLTGGNLLPSRASQETIVITEDTYADIPRISIQDAKAAYDIGSAVFVDVRDAQSFAQSHIKGALSIPLDELPNRLNELKSSDWIVTYCT